MAENVALVHELRAKEDQLEQYYRSLVTRDDEPGKYARAVAEGRLLQIRQDIAALARAESAP